MISHAEAFEFAQSLGCEYVEISTKQLEGLNDLVAAVVRTHCKNILNRNTALKISTKQKLSLLSSFKNVLMGNKVSRAATTDQTIFAQTYSNVEMDRNFRPI